MSDAIYNLALAIWGKFFCKHDWHVSASVSMEDANTGIQLSQVDHMRCIVCNNKKKVKIQ